MASPLSLRFPVSSFPIPTRTTTPLASVRTKPTPVGNHPPFHPQSMSIRRINRLIINAIEQGRQDNSSESETLSSSAQQDEPPQPETSNRVDASSESSEMKKEGEGADLWSGVAEEVREIEWPAFGKVLGITGVVLGVIAGSSVVLLTVNAVLAELSDRVFAGKGVQDFFS